MVDPLTVSMIVVGTTAASTASGAGVYCLLKKLYKERRRRVRANIWRTNSSWLDVLDVGEMLEADLVPLENISHRPVFTLSDDSLCSIPLDENYR